MNNSAISGDLSGPNGPDGPNHRPAAKNSPQAIFERLQGIRRADRTGQNPKNPPELPRCAYVDTPLCENPNDPLHVNELPLQRTPERVQAEIGACTRAKELEGMLECATSVSGYLIAHDTDAYEWFRPYVHELRVEAERARTYADEICGEMLGGVGTTSLYDVTCLEEPVRGNEGKADAGAGDEEEEIFRKKRPHCPLCNSLKLVRTRQRKYSGKAMNIGKGAWDCLTCGEAFSKPVWKRPFWKSDMELALEDIEKRRHQARKNFLEGELWRHAARHIIRDGNCTLDDVEAAQVLVGFADTCIGAWVYAELDRALNEEARKVRFKWLMPYVEQVNAAKNMAKRKGKLVGADVEVAIKRAPEIAPPEARMARMLGMLRGGK